MSGKNDERGIMNLGHSFQRSMRMRSSLMSHRRQSASQSPPMEASRPPMSNPILPIVLYDRAPSQIRAEAGGAETQVR